MYCVKCGVKLQDDMTCCPLCGTKVAYLTNEEVTTQTNYSPTLPNKRHGDMSSASILTALCLIAMLTILIVCLNLYHRLSWGGYAIFGILLFYCIFILPLWFYKPNPVVFIPIDHLAISLYLLYISIVTKGEWFLSFALPLTVVSCIILTTLVSLVKYVKKGGYFIAGGIIIGIGLSTILIEFFQHITFHTPMFIWSLYVVTSCSIVGIFFILAGLIKPLRDYLDKQFFI